MYANKSYMIYVDPMTIDTPKFKILENTLRNFFDRQITMSGIKHVYQRTVSRSLNLAQLLIWAAKTLLVNLIRKDQSRSIQWFKTIFPLSVRHK